MPNANTVKVRIDHAQTELSATTQKRVAALGHAAAVPAAVTTHRRKQETYGHHKGRMPLVQKQEKMKAKLRTFDVIDGARDESSKEANKGLARSARLQLILPERSVDRLETIKEATEAASYAEVIRRSLRLYEGFLAETQEGGQLIMKRKDGTEIQVPLYRMMV